MCGEYSTRFLLSFDLRKQLCLFPLEKLVLSRAQVSSALSPALLARARFSRQGGRRTGCLLTFREANCQSQRPEVKTKERLCL